MTSSDKGTISTTQSGGIALASGAAAVSTLLITVLAARGLTQLQGPQAYKEFTVFWGLFFGSVSVVAGIQNELTRAVGTQQRRVNHDRSGTKAMWAPVILGGLVAALLLVFSPWWGPALLPSASPAAIVLLCAGVWLMAGYQAFLGIVSGVRRWSVFAALLGTDAGLRFGLVLAAFLLGSTLGGYQIASVLAGVGWVGWLVFSPSTRACSGARTDVGLRRLLTNSAFAMISAAASAVLVTAFPVFVQLSHAGSDAALLGSLITAISLTRSTLMIPLQAFQGVAISAFLAKKERSARTLLRPLMAVLVVSVLGSLLASAIGPWFLRTLYGPVFVLPGIVFAALMVASGLLGMLLLTGTAVLADNRHRLFSLGWVTAALVAVGCVSWIEEPVTAVVVALMVGPLVGVMIHLTGLSAARPVNNVPRF